MNFVHSCVWQLFLKNKRWDDEMGICAHRIATPLLFWRATAPQRVRAEPGRQTHVCAIHSRKAACLLKVLPTVTGKLFLIFCLELGALHSGFPVLCPSCPPHRYAVAFRTIGGRSEASTYSEAYSERLEPLIIVAAIVCGCCISLVLYSMVYGCDFVLCTVADNSTEHLPYSHPHPHPSLFSAR